jgi:hypothetical protein
VIVLLLFCALEAQAITWDFNEEDDLQGWMAREGNMAGDGSIQQALRSEVRDGIWRIDIPAFESDRNPEALLISPIIGHDSELFDRMIIRLRVVHIQPIPGEFRMEWTNLTNITYPGSDPSSREGPCANLNCYPRFWLLSNPTYTTDWQEIALSDLRSRTAIWPGGDEYEILWEGKLTEVRLVLGLVDRGKHDNDNPYVQGPDEVPEAVEIDWIRLTGVEEQLQGELPPPQTAAGLSSGSLFEAPVFYPLGVRSIGSPYGSQGAGALGDLEGDGDLDLVASWSSGKDSGWLLAYNDGKGGFGHPLTAPFPPGDGNAQFVGGTDLDGNGRMDLVLHPGTGRPVQIWMNDAEKGWEVKEMPGLRPLQLIDLDQDGDLDIWSFDDDLSRFFVSRFLYNLGKGNFSPPVFAPAIQFDEGNGVFSTPVTLESPTGGYVATAAVYPTTAEKRLAFLWSRGSGKYLVYQTPSGEIVQEFLADLRRLDWFHAIQVGDFDLDGHTDLITCDRLGEITNDDGLAPVGLNVLHNRGDGQMDTVFALPDIRYTLKVQVTDINRDGLADVVVLDKNIRSPAIRVLTGQSDGRFVEEGRYPLGKGRGGPTLSGDLDNDGDVDLVVFESFVAGGGGVHVLLSRLANQITTVEEEAATIPSQSYLGTAYPNPFNSGVVIPFTLESAGAPAKLAIYNIVGQEVRQMGLGSLAPGSHQITWDGLDQQGKALPSGVYLYRLQADSWSAVGKVVKAE